MLRVAARRVGARGHDVWGGGVSHGFPGSDELRLPYNTRRAKSIATYRAIHRAKTFGAMAIYGFFRKNPPNLKIWRNNSASAIVRNLPKSSAIQTICHQSAKGHHARAMESRRRAGSSTPSRKFSATPAPKTAPAGCASGKRPANDVPAALAYQF